MTDCRYGLSAPEEAPESGPTSAIDEEADGDNAAAGAIWRRHLSAKERKLMKKQVSAEVSYSQVWSFCQQHHTSSRSRWVTFISVPFVCSYAHECQC